MAVRLQMKLGVVAEQDRLPDSPDTVVVVEPSVGSVARSKGHLYLLVTSRIPGQRAHEATRLAAETIRNEYYYDESGSIRVRLQKAIALANRRLAHQRERLGLGQPGDASGPIGVAAAVVRGSELHVVTVGPADVYLIRQARLSTLPDPHRDRGLPAIQLGSDVWRGEVNVGDSLVLISPNVVDLLGPEELKDAMVTLHPQSAMEHLHRRFVAAGGDGSDGGVAFEATEVAGGQGRRAFARAPGPEPQDDEPDTQIGVADPVAGGVAAVQAGARQARQAAESAVERGIGGLQELLPSPRTKYRRVTPASSRRETQRRAVVALVAFVAVAFGLGAAVFLAPRGPASSGAGSSLTPGQRALDTAQTNLARVVGPDLDLVESDPDRAQALLSEAYAELEKAEQAGVAERTIGPIRAEVVEGLDRLYRMITVEVRTGYQFDPAVIGGLDFGTLVRGPDLGPYLINRVDNVVWRVNLREAIATPVFQEGIDYSGLLTGFPKLMTAGGPDLIILDSKNAVWRWQPTDEVGGGTTALLPVNGSADWGEDIVGIGAYLRDAERGIYNLYVLDPSLEQILSYSAAADGGFPAPGEPWLNSPRDVSAVTAMYIDGDIYLSSGGKVERFSAGQSDGWEPEEPGDDLLRDAPQYTLLTSTSSRREGRIYAFDDVNDRVLAFDKSESDGTFLEQYRLPEGNDGWSDIRGMYVAQGAEGPPTLVWITGAAIHFSDLVAAPEPDASSSPDASAPDAPSDPSASPDASAPAAVAP